MKSIVSKFVMVSFSLALFLFTMNGWASLNSFIPSYQYLAVQDYIIRDGLGISGAYSITLGSGTQKNIGVIPDGNGDFTLVSTPYTATGGSFNLIYDATNNNGTAVCNAIIPVQVNLNTQNQITITTPVTTVTTTGGPMPGQPACAFNTMNLRVDGNPGSTDGYSLALMKFTE